MQSINVQRMAVQAALTGDVTLLKQAVLLDPLTGAVCNPPEVWQMVDEMLLAQEQWLPQYQDAIAEAKARFEKGDLLPTKEDYQGAARLHVKTVDEMSVDKEKARYVRRCCEGKYRGLIQVFKSHAAHLRHGF